MSEATANTPEEAVTEEAATEETATEPTVETDDNGIPVIIADDFGRMAYEKAKSESERLVAVTAEIDAYQGNASAMQDKFRETWGTDADSDATDEDRKARAQLDKLFEAVLKIEQARDEKINARIAELTKDAATAVAPLLEQQGKIRDTVNSARKMLVSMFGEDAVYGLPVVKSARKSGGSGSGTSAPRVRGFDVYVNGKIATQADKDGNQKSNLAAAAKAANVATAVMQQGFWQAQGTQDSKAFKDKVEFTVKDADGNEYAVIAQRQAGE